MGVASHGVSSGKVGDAAGGGEDEEVTSGAGPRLRRRRGVVPRRLRVDGHRRGAGQSGARGDGRNGRSAGSLAAAASVAGAEAISTRSNRRRRTSARRGVRVRTAVPDEPRPVDDRPPLIVVRAARPATPATASPLVPDHALKTDEEDDEDIELFTVEELAERIRDQRAALRAISAKNASLREELAVSNVAREEANAALARATSREEAAEAELRRSAERCAEIEAGRRSAARRWRRWRRKTRDWCPRFPPRRKRRVTCAGRWTARNVRRNPSHSPSRRNFETRGKRRVNFARRCRAATRI